MATCDPQTLLNDGSCFLCLSEKELNVAVAQLLCDIASGGVPCACENLGGADSPLNNITPDFIGQVYVQDSGVVWQAGSLLSSSWTAICDPSGGGGGMIWGPDATELDQFVYSLGDAVTTLNFPTLAAVAGDFDFSAASFLTQLLAPNLVSAGQILAYNQISEVDFGSLVEVTTGDFDLDSNSSLTELLLPNLETVSGELLVNQCGLTSLSLPLFVTCGNLDCSGNLLTSLFLPVFVGNGLSCDGNQLTSLSLPAMVTGTIICLGNLLTSISAPVYECGGNVFFCDNNQLSTLSLPAFAAFSEFHASNNLLTSISAPNMAASNFGFETIDVTNNALNAATIAFLLHVGVVAGWSSAGQSMLLDGGTNAGLASLSVQGQADYATLFAAGVTITINP